MSLPLPLWLTGWGSVPAPWTGVRQIETRRLRLAGRVLTTLPGLGRMQQPLDVTQLLVHFPTVIGWGLVRRLGQIDGDLLSTAVTTARLFVTG